MALPLADQSSLAVHPPLQGRTLLIVRVGWVVMALFSLGLFLFAIPHHLISITIGVPLDERIALMQMGYTVRTFVSYVLIYQIVVVLGYTLTALALFIYKGNNWMTVFVSLAMLTFGVSISPHYSFEPVLLSLMNANQALTPAVLALFAAGIGSMLIVFYLFPDGRFVPSWTRYLSYLWMAWLVAFWVLPSWNLMDAGNPIVRYILRMLSVKPEELTSLASHLRLYSLTLVIFVWFASGVFAQIYRYLRTSSPVNRHQTKWAVLGFTAAVVIFFGLYLPILIMKASGAPALALMRYQWFVLPLTTLGLLLFPISLIVSVLRSRLWDVDFLINRTLVYGLVTAFLMVMYFGSVLLFQSLFRSLTGYEDTLSIAITTLVIALLFQPLRRRIQEGIDRRFYREKANFRQVFTEFAEEVRTIIDLTELLRVLVTRTGELLHTQYGAVYLKGNTGEFHLSQAYQLCDCQPQTLALNERQLERLQAGQVVSQPRDGSYPMLVPLLAPQSSRQAGGAPPLLGVLALGPLLSGLHFSREDQPLMVSLADQAGTAIFVAQLIQETQQETRRRQDAEQRLEAHRNSPIGRAELLAQSILQKPETGLEAIHALAQQAGRDADAANLLGNLPKVLDNLAAGPLVGLAEGCNYLFNSQFTPELLPIGLRTLISALAWEGLPNDPTLIERCRALTVYRLCLAALEANSIAQITAIKDLERPESTAEDCGTIQPEAFVLSDLEKALYELQTVVETLHAYERVDTSQDKLIYLASAIQSLRHIDHTARTELGSGDRPLVQRVVESWLAIVTSAMSELQTSARLVCQLLTRNTWQGDIVSLALSVQNQGRGAALELKVSLAPSPEYTLLDETALVERLAPGEEAQVHLRVRPHLAAGADHFRARFVILYTDPRGPDQVDNFADVVHLMTAGGEFQFVPNPYVVGTPLQTGSPLFFGREDLVRFIKENLAAQHRNNLVLIGQRRTGKTSLLKQLPARLDDNYLPVYLDGQTLGLDPGLPNFFLNLATEIAFALEDRGFIIDPPVLENFQASPSSAFEHSFLENVRKLIGSRHLLIMFDEFEELEAAVRRGNIEASIFGFLRHLIQHSQNLSVIFCGTHRIEELAADYWNVLFNISLYQHIAFLEKSEALRLIQDPVAPFEMGYDDLALDKMWRVTAGHPYFLQLLCHSLVNRHNRTGRSYLTIADLNAALDEILASGEAHFVYLWTESSHQERLALTALSRMIPLTGQASLVQFMDFFAERGISVERHEINEALHHLTLRDILEVNRDGDGAREEAYRWKLGLLGLWVEKYRSLSRVVDEAL